MKEKITVMQDALLRCQNAHNKNPLLFPFDAIIRQLEYLINLETGVTTDYSNLKNIKIGWIAVRELDSYEDPELINLLCKISREAEKKLDEKKLSECNKK